MTGPATQATVVRLLGAREAVERVAELSAVLMDCVEGGASVSFIAPLTRPRADEFWRRVAEGVAANDRLLLVAEEPSSGEIVGTVQVVFAGPENQPHRGDVAKMLVRRSARRQGLGARLMGAAEEVDWAGPESASCRTTPCGPTEDFATRRSSTNDCRAAERGRPSGVVRARRARR